MHEKHPDLPTSAELRERWRKLAMQKLREIPTDPAELHKFARQQTQKLRKLGIVPRRRRRRRR